MTLAAGRGLRHRRWQTVLAVAAIGAAVALPVVLIGVGGGVAQHELASLESSGYQLSVSGAGVHGISDAHNLTAAIERTAGVASASPILSVAVDAFNASGAVVGVLAEGVIPATFTSTLGPTERGLFPEPLPLGDPTDRVHWANGTYQGSATWDVLVSSPFAIGFGVRPGDTLRVAPSVNVSQAIVCNVTGVFGVPLLFGQPSGAYAVLLPLSDLQVLTHLATGPGTTIPDAADTVEVVATSAVAGDPSSLAALQHELSVRYPFYTVTSLSQEAAQLEEASSLLTGFYLALSSVGLSVGLIFLALVLVRRVEQERRELGIRRAIGVPVRSIAVGLLVDGAFLAGAGGIVGVVAGYAVVRGLATYGRSTVQLAASLAVFDPVTLVALVAGVVALSLLAGGVAGRSALKLDLLEALR
jgi:ABC-type lipoprotein release transport system permease subunit